VLGEEGDDQFGPLVAVLEFQVAAAAE